MHIKYHEINIETFTQHYIFNQCERNCKLDLQLVQLKHIKCMYKLNTLNIYNCVNVDSVRNDQYRNRLFQKLSNGNYLNISYACFTQL